MEPVTEKFTPRPTAAHAHRGSDAHPSLQAAVADGPALPTGSADDAADAPPTFTAPARLRQPEYRPVGSPPWGEP